MALHPATLSCLQVFFSVVETGSFSAAAEALHITQSAVSHRIKQLESILETELIQRTTRHIKITNAGERLYQGTHKELVEIERVIESIKRANDAHLNLTTISSLATNWLLPNLSRYNEQFPTQPLSVIADDNVVDLKFEGIDAAIRLTSKADPLLHMTHICDEWVFPVASPDLVEEPDIIDNPAALLNYPLLIDTVAQKGTDESSWEGWLATQGLTLSSTIKSQKFNRADIALQAVVAGQGITIARTSLVEQNMVEMGLFRQVGKAVKMNHSYYFVCQPEDATKPAINNLRDWVKTEMENTFQKVRALLIT